MTRALNEMLGYICSISSVGQSEVEVSGHADGGGRCDPWVDLCVCLFWCTFHFVTAESN